MIKINNYSLTINNKKILSNINYDFKSGISAIIGPSGVGKSSLVMALTRLCELSNEVKHEGEILFENTNILNPKFNIEALRNKIGTVFQKPTPFPVSILKNLKIIIEQNKSISQNDHEKIIEKTLKEVMLWEEVKNNLDQNALKLSGGQQQKLCIARSLLLDPQVLILDEPCSSLDPISTEQIESLISEISKKRMVIIVTHNLKQARRLAHSLIVMGKVENCGTIIEHGESIRIFSTPETEFTRLYLHYQLL